MSMLNQMYTNRITDVFWNRHLPLPRVVTVDWVHDSWKEKTLLDEERKSEWLQCCGALLICLRVRRATVESGTPVMSENANAEGVLRRLLRVCQCSTFTLNQRGASILI